MFNDISRLGKYLGQAARLMVGMPDYVVDAVLHFDALAAVAAYPGPTLFANGAWDQFRLHEKRFVETAADGRLVVVPRAMHLFPLIQPEFTAGLIDDFADTVDSADRAPLH